MSRCDSAAIVPEVVFPRAADPDQLHGDEGIHMEMDIDVDDQGRPEPPLAGNEAETLVGFLEFHRATFEWKCAGLDADGLRSTVGASTMTLAGLLKHLALVEDDWFGAKLLGLPDDEPWASVD
jgi:hypothetical protein